MLSLTPPAAFPPQVQQFCREWPSQPSLRFVFELDGALIDAAGEPVQRNVQYLRQVRNASA